MSADLIVHQPRAPASTLVLLFHGVGASADDLEPLGEFIAGAQPQALVVSINAPVASDLGRGWQWFSVQGVTEANRPARVAAALPAFDACIAQWQARTGVGAHDTVLVGFSQGAIMALESTQRDAVPAPARRVVAIAGRFAQAPRRAPAGVAFHLLHGEQDTVMPVALARDAATQLRALGARVAIDTFAGLGHGIDARVAQRVVEQLAAVP